MSQSQKKHCRCVFVHSCECWLLVHQLCCSRKKVAQVAQFYLVWSTPTDVVTLARFWKKWHPYLQLYDYFCFISWISGPHGRQETRKMAKCANRVSTFIHPLFLSKLLTSPSTSGSKRLPCPTAYKLQCSINSWSFGRSAAAAWNIGAKSSSFDSQSSHTTAKDTFYWITGSPKVSVDLTPKLQMRAVNRRISLEFH